MFHAEQRITRTVPRAHSARGKFIEALARAFMNISEEDMNAKKQKLSDDGMVIQMYKYFLGVGLLVLLC